MLYLLIALLVIVAALAVVAVRRRRRDQVVIDLRTLDQWEATRRAFASRDAGAIAVGHAIGVVFVLALLVLLMAAVGGIETAGL